MLLLVQRHCPEQPAVVFEREVARRPARVLGYAAGLFGGEQEFVAQEGIGIARE